MLGLMVMSYSIPLHFTEVTEVVSMGVPWWSGLVVSLCVCVCERETESQLNQYYDAEFICAD